MFMRPYLKGQASCFYTSYLGGIQTPSFALNSQFKGDVISFFLDEIENHTKRVCAENKGY